MQIVYQQGVRVSEIDSGVTVYESDLLGQVIRLPVIVRVEEGDEASARDEQARVAGRARPAILLLQVDDAVGAARQAALDLVACRASRR